MRRILFVCLGNICRSPLVEAVARQELAKAGLDVLVASCGTGDWHIGKSADSRMRAAANAAGYNLDAHRARTWQATDAENFDLILVMDRANLHELRRRAPGHVAKMALFLEWASAAPPDEFPDPYDGKASDFAASVILAERGVQAMIAQLRSR